jgi:leucine dehydrogenase
MASMSGISKDVINPSVFEHTDYRGHQQVIFVSDEASGLRAIIAIHHLRGGRTGGGIRFYPYASGAEALTDVLRLSRAMTYKMVLGGLPVGGGKSVILGDPKTEKTPELLRAFGRIVEGLGGRYICAPDVGTNAHDMAVIRQETEFVTGLPGSGGNTAIPTARGVFEGIRAAVEFKYTRNGLTGVRVAVQGLGGVGSRLCAHLHDAGAELVVSDVDEVALGRVVDETGAEALDPSEILFAEAEVLAPCALGAVLNDQTIPKLRASIVCGGANNQLAEVRHARMLKERGILFAPDYVVNAGGTLGGAAQVGLITKAQMEASLSGIGETLRWIVRIAEERDLSTEEAASSLAEEKLLEEGRTIPIHPSA